MWAPAALIKTGSMQHNLHKHHAKRGETQNNPKTQNTHLKGQSTTCFYSSQIYITFYYPSFRYCFF